MIQEWIDISGEVLAIFSLFRGDYTKGLYGSLIAQKLPVSQSTVSRKLEVLEKEGVLTYKMEGKNKVFYPNLENPSTKNRLVMAELYYKERFLRNSSRVQVIWEALKKEDAISGTVVLFGSYAKELARGGSDIDLLVIGDVDSKKVREVEETYNKKINIKQVESFDDFEKSLVEGDSLIKEIIENHVVLDRTEPFVDVLWRYFGGIKR